MRGVQVAILSLWAHLALGAHTVIGSAQYNLLEDTLSSQIKQWGKKLLVRRRQGTVRLEDPIPLENTFEASPSGSARQAFRDDSREFCRLTRSI
ncbi:hypothetical protein T484DRAFT_1806883 [Baffinella frigidus]|nr:hypothetical protein T484DRAFT_1806883 [Cryptophyta sp. CCMP2293]